MGRRGRRLDRLMKRRVVSGSWEGVCSGCNLNWIFASDVVGRFLWYCYSSFYII